MNRGSVINNSGASYKSITVVFIVLLVAAVAAFATWYKMSRVVPQPGWISSDKRSDFLYGSVERQGAAGIPYWIWLSLPRLFPEYLPGPGGYASLGFAWEETREMPAGFSKQTVGYVRVTGNCAICHAYSRSNGPDAAPTVFAAGPGHTEQIQSLLAFYQNCARDPRFNAANILDEVSMATRLSLVDRLIYRYILIPRTRQRLITQDTIIIDQALWRHSQDPRISPAYKQKIETLESGLEGPERAELARYLSTLP